MQLIFDHITAIVVASVLLMTLFTVNLRTQENAIDAERFRAAKVRQSALIDLIEYDLEDLGSGVPAGQQMITAFDKDVFGIRVFEFRRELANADGNPTIATVRYERVQDGFYETADGSVLPRFRILRKVEANGGAMARSTGTGFNVVSLDFDLRGLDGEPVTSNLNAAASVGVHLRTSLPFQDDGKMRYMSWEGAFRPSNLAYRAGASGGVGVGS